jgi:hypothetical protein
MGNLGFEPKSARHYSREIATLEDQIAALDGELALVDRQINDAQARADALTSDRPGRIEALLKGEGLDYVRSPEPDPEIARLRTKRIDLLDARELGRKKLEALVGPVNTEVARLAFPAHQKLVAEMAESAERFLKAAKNEQAFRGAFGAVGLVYPRNEAAWPGGLDAFIFRLESWLKDVKRAGLLR